MIKNIYAVLFLILSFASTSQAASRPLPLVNHQFHVSKCQIDYSSQEQALQITLHLFIDDLEAALQLQGAENLYICTPKEHKKAEKYIGRYLKQHFNLVVNEATVDYDFLGKEQSDDLQAVWCYLEIPNVNQLNSLEITNSLLMEAFEDQKNIVQFKNANGKQGYFMFQKGAETDKVTF